MTSDGGPYRIDRDDLLARVDLRHLLDSLTPGQGNGHHRRWRCPAVEHPDQHPSVTVAVDRHGFERWRCWSGGHGGTAIDAVMAARHLNVGESILWLNDHHGQLSALPSRAPDPPALPAGRPSSDVIEYVERCERMLWTPAGRSTLAWLNDRGLVNEVLVANRVGADPGRRLVPRGRGLPDGEPAVVYPALDRDGNVTYFQARFMKRDDKRPKYDNPARSLANNPRLAWTQPVGSPAKGGPLIVAEGIPDALIAAGAGMRSVGVLGSTVPSQQVADLLAQAARPRAGRDPSVVLCFDADQAGRAGAARLAALLERRGIFAANVEPPADLDLTDWASADAEWIDQVLGGSVRVERDLTGTADVDEMEVHFGP